MSPALAGGFFTTKPPQKPLDPISDDALPAKFFPFCSYFLLPFYHFLMIFIFDSIVVPVRFHLSLVSELLFFFPLTLLHTHGDVHKTEQLAAGHGHYDVAQNILCCLAYKSLNFASGRCIEVSVQRV